MITFRPLDLVTDRLALSRLDTSFTTDRIYCLEQTAHACRLVESQVTPAVQKAYRLDDLATLDWVLAAANDADLLGLVALRVETWNGRAILHHVYVTAGARGNGIGRTLVEAAAAEATRRRARVLWTETQTVNYGAVQFYERVGFVWCGFDTSLYDPSVVSAGEKALFFERSLTS